MALFLPSKGWAVVKGLKWVFTYLYIEAVVLGLCGCFVLCEFHSRR